MMTATLFAAVAATATLLPGVTAPGLPPPKDRASMGLAVFNADDPRAPDASRVAGGLALAG